jgi:hypothetical protein
MLLLTRVHVCCVLCLRKVDFGELEICSVATRDSWAAKTEAATEIYGSITFTRSADFSLGSRYLFLFVRRSQQELYTRK